MNTKSKEKKRFLSSEVGLDKIKPDSKKKILLCIL
jgi:hypothetical protein